MRLRQGFRPRDYVNYSFLGTLYAWLPVPFLSFPPFFCHIIFLLTSAGQTGKPISMAEGLNDAFPSTQGSAFLGFPGSITPKNRQKEGVAYSFPVNFGESLKTHISVKSRESDTKFEL
jgi:hypothetical protein